MRKLIAAMKISLDEKVTDANGYADWVEAWSDDYGLAHEIDACLLGAGMYPGYEAYWTAIGAAPEAPLAMTGKPPTPGEVEWAKVAARTPHFVLSRTSSAAAWPHTRFLRDMRGVAALKEEPGRAIYLVGGAKTTASLIDAGLVDELRLIVYPALAGEGRPLFSPAARRRPLAFTDARRLPDGRIRIDCAFG
jgi:dihydrofolate reductase